LLGQLELHRTASFLLNHDRTIANSAARANVIHLQAHEIASSQLAVDSEIEHCEIALAAFNL
jgi:hypothetical protein